MYPLSELNQTSFPADHTVAIAGDRNYSWGQLVADVCATRAEIRGDEAAGWALFHPDTYSFAVGLLALLAEKKAVYLPADNHAGISADLRHRKLNLLGDFSDQRCQQICLEQLPGPANSFSLGGTVVVYTSGSTGTAKAIPKTLQQLDQELLTLESYWSKTWTAPVIASTVSHQHFYGLLFALLWPLCAGRRFYREPFLDPAIMASSTNSFEQTVWVMSPAHLHRLPQHMPWQQVQGKVAALFSSGGPLQQQAATDVFKALGQYPIEVLGSSETGGIASRQQHTSNTPWRPLPGVAVQLGPDNALMVRSPWLDDDDWYLSADRATLVPEGMFQLGMRTDRIVKLEGKRVALPEVEAALDQHPWITEAAVTVVSRQRQCLGAVIVLSTAGLLAEAESGRHVFTRELRHYLRQHLSSAAIPRLWRLAPNLPRNPQGKILSHAMTAMFDNRPLPDLIRREDTANGCVLELYISENSPYFKGHFPENPVLPGVTQLMWAQHFGRQYLGIRGDFSGMKAIKFRDLIFPKQTLSLTLEYAGESGRLTFHYDSGGSRHSQGILIFEVDA